MRILGISILALAAAVTAGSLAPLAAQAPAPAPDQAMQGKRVFIRCASCHAIGANAAGRIGPNLAGVVGRKAGSLAGYSYSPAMAKQTFVWDDAKLDRWLTQPAALVPGTAMAFAGLPRPEDRAAVIAYLKNPAK